MTTTPRSGSAARPQQGRRRRRPTTAAPATRDQQHAKNGQNGQHGQHGQNGPHGQRGRDDQQRSSTSIAEVTPAPAVPAVDDFGALGVPQALVDVLAAGGVTTPFPIQCATVPDSLAGRDVLGRGRTGSGKTLAFSLPTVLRLVAASNEGRGRRQSKRPRALVLVPTRELANQVAETLAPLVSATGLKMVTIFGGVGQQPQVQALRTGVDIVVACPGRLEDLVQQRHCALDAVEITVLDEADHMADLGFLPVVKRLLDATPANAQRLLFSATLDRGVDVLVQRYLTDPVVHSVDPAVAPVSTMEHHVFAVAATDKPAVVHALAGGRERSLLFTRTKHGAKKLAKQLTQAGIPAVELHGNLSQNARERNLESFSEGSTRVLVATDIAARGIHVDDVALVVHVDPPAEHKAYLHRSGRTARAGAEGVVVTLMTPDQVGDVRALAKAAAIEPRITRVTPGHAAITDLVGEPAPFVKPAVSVAAPPAPRQRQTAAPSRQQRPGRPSSGDGRQREAAAPRQDGAPRVGAATGGRSSADGGRDGQSRRGGAGAGGAGGRGRRSRGR